MVIVLLGVSGSGKSTVGRLLAQRTGFEYYEGDDFHSAANRAKMHGGQPLDDEDRRPWLVAIHTKIAEVLGRGGNAVVTCSALKRAYRDVLRQEGLQFVYLKGDRATIRKRLESRRGHFFNPVLLDSQFDTLEEPTRALAVDVAQSPEAIVAEIIQRLALAPASH